MEVKKVWEPFRAGDGRVFFCKRIGERSDATGKWKLDFGSSKFEFPEEPEDKVIGDGILAVNDPGSWDCFRDSSSGEYYFCNRLSGEKSWRIPPGCEGKQPVNVKESWLTFVCADRQNRRYYFNKMSKESTWLRPQELGKPSDDEDGHDGDDGLDTFVDDGGDEFVVPEETGFYESEEEVDDEAIENIENQDKEGLAVAYESDGSSNRSESWMGSAAVERERRLEALRKTFEEENSAKIRSAFEFLLEERGVQPYSQWTNWWKKLGNEPRVADVPIDERARWFTAFARGLIGKEREVRKRRIKAARRLVFTLSHNKGVEGKTLVERCGNSTDNLLSGIDAVMKNPESTIDKEFAFRLRQSLQILSQKDRLKVFNR